MTLTHPDADAFVRGILADPADRVRRLIFADWLDELDQESPTAWAGYLRAQAECETLPANHPMRAESLARAESFRPRIRARLKLPARDVQSRFLHLTRLLPPANVRIQLTDATIPLAIIQITPESVAREFAAIPVGLEGGTLALATPYPWNQRHFDQLEMIHNRSVILFSADASEVTSAIDRFYGPSETESVDSTSYESPMIGLGIQELFSLFHELFERQYTAFALTVNDRSGLIVRYRGTHESTGLPFSREAYHTLLDHLLSLEVEAESTAGRTTTRRVNLPLLSGRPCPVDFQHPSGEEPIRSFRVDFRWYT